jgi:hypothetical protein
VDDLRRELQALTGVERRALQDQEPQMLIDARGVERRTIVRGGAVHEKQRHLRIRQAAFEQRVLIDMRAEAQLQVLRACNRARLQGRGADARVQRHEHAHVMTLRMQVPRQHARYVSETAGLRERSDLRRDETNANGHQAFWPLPLGAASASLMKLATLFSR